MKLWISKQSDLHQSNFFWENLLRFRASRNDRDARTYESRLKQYENEIGELKARLDAITLDATRRIEENEVRPIDLLIEFIWIVF